MKKLSDYKNNILKDTIEAEAYLNAALEAYFVDHNKEMFLVALKEVIEAQGGVTKIAKEADINRQHIYKMLSAEGNPTLDKMGSLLSVLGYKLVVEKQNHNNQF